LSLLFKYPELGPVSMFIEEKEGNYHLHKPLPKKVDGDILFIFGIFPISKEFTLLVKNHPLVEFVFLVETLGELLFFINNKMDKGFDKDRIHVHWKEDGKQISDWAEEIAAMYPYERVSFFQNGMEGEKYELISKTFLRKLVLETSVHKELLNYPFLCENLFANMHHFSRAFDFGRWKDQFKGTAAVIVGAGPSLSGVKSDLKKIEDKALLFAGGSSITALDKMGIAAHLLFAIDPNKEEYHRLRYSHCKGAPLIYGGRVQKEIFRFFPGELGYVRSDTGGLFEAYVEDKLGVKDEGILKDLSEEALSITSICLMSAIYLGCDPIYFAGVDLSLKNGARYSENLTGHQENFLRDDPSQQVRWMMEKDVIDDVVKKHPNISFFDLTGAGMTFKNVPVKRFQEAIFEEKGNLREKIVNLSLESKFTITPFQIIEIQKEIKNSLEALCVLINTFLEGKSGESLFIYNVENNLSYKLFFQGMVYAIETPLLKQLKLTNKSITGERLLKSIYIKVLKEAIKLSSLIRF
jgi:hypothetical protein